MKLTKIRWLDHPELTYQLCEYVFCVCVCVCKHMNAKNPKYTVNIDHWLSQVARKGDC